MNCTIHKATSHSVVVPKPSKEGKEAAIHLLQMQSHNQTHTDDMINSNPIDHQLSTYVSNGKFISQYREDEDERTHRHRVQLSYSFGMLQVVTPTPAFVIKATRMDKTKVFVNVCSHDLVPYNGDVESNAIKLIYMLVGAPIELMSETNCSYCVVYDVVVHPEEIGRSMADSSGKACRRVSDLLIHINLHYFIIREF